MKNCKNVNNNKKLVKQFLGGIFPGRNFPEGIFPGGQFSGEQFSRGAIFRGAFSGHQANVWLIFKIYQELH